VDREQAVILGQNFFFLFRCRGKGAQQTQVIKYANDCESCQNGILLESVSKFGKISLRFNLIASSLRKVMQNRVIRVSPTNISAMAPRRYG